jgi:trehalose 6-phosphate phosphatase
MEYLLSRASGVVLTRLTRQRTLCAFDFDGTLAPIVAHPSLAEMRESTQNLLARLAGLHPCVIVSGRARADVLGRLSGVKVARVIGNHGAETEVSGRAPLRRVARWKACLETELAGLAGVWVEDKRLSLAVHYRQAPEKAEARRQILAATANLRQVHVYGGKQVVNLVPEKALNKGQALAAERDRLRCDWVLYVGDDVNDEDAFALEGNVVSVRIGRKLRSHARYYLRTQAEIDELLARIIRLQVA